MFTKTNKMMWQVLRIGTLFCFIGLLFSLPCSAQKAPKGKAVAVFNELFIMTGGDCHTARGSGAFNVSKLIHEGLVGKDLDGRIVPALAKSWEIAKDGLSIKFTLNERAKFHNGEPVTAEDVKFSIERAMRPELKYRSLTQLRRTIDRIEVMDDHHVTVYLKMYFPGLFELSTQHLGIVPKAYVEKVGDQEFAKHPIGAGPFRWIDYQQDVFVKVEAVEDHYRQVPRVKILEGKCITEDATITAMFKAGEADVLMLPLSSYVEVKNNPKLRVIMSKFTIGPVLQFWDLQFPNEPSPFHDVRVRRAASYAINRKAICEKILHGCAEPWGDIYAPYNLGVDPNRYKPFPYDPQKAKALLKEAGYPNGFDTTIPCGFLGDKIVSQAIAADLAKVGIRAKLDEMEFGTFFMRVVERKHRGISRAVQPYWVGQTHPAFATESALFSENVWSCYTSPEQDVAWRKLSVLRDEKEIEAQAKELSRLFHEQEIKYMLYAEHQPIGLSRRVKFYKTFPGWRSLGGFEWLELKD